MNEPRASRLSYSLILEIIQSKARGKSKLVVGFGFVDHVLEFEDLHRGRQTPTLSSVIFYPNRCRLVRDDILKVSTAYISVVCMTRNITRVYLYVCYEGDRTLF